MSFVFIIMNFKPVYRVPQAATKFFSPLFYNLYLGRRYF